MRDAFLGGQGGRGLLDDAKENPRPARCQEQDSVLPFRLPREDVEAPSLKVLKARLDGT